MTKFQKTAATIAAGGAMLLQTAMPAFAATNLVISGNGSDSDNDINVTQTKTTTVTQSNETEVKNKVKVNADTGNNTANDNTGGDVNITTGDADVDVVVDNFLNSNDAVLESCGTCLEDAHVLIEGNGTNSTNNADLNHTSTTDLFQDNKADVENDVEIEAETGENKANDNTGGDIKIVTGDVDVKAKVKTEANHNFASVGPSSGSGGNVDVKILNNGSDSDNDANLTLLQTLGVTQTNDTEIDNDLDIDGDSGDNEANDNTGGEVLIKTSPGGVDIDAKVLNYAGFNYFDDGECCFDDIYAKIGENGTESESDIMATLDNTDTVFQTNACGDNACFDNEVEVEGESGENKANDNTGDADTDPAITTGASDVVLKVENEGGFNTIGDFDGPQGSGAGQSPLTIGIDVAALLDALAGLGISVN